MVLAPQSVLEVLFEPPAFGEVIEISADANDEYEIIVFSGSHRVAMLRAPAVPGCDGMQARYLLLPVHADERGVDKLLIRPVSGDGRCSVGHVFIYEDSLRE